MATTVRRLAWGLGAFAVAAAAVVVLREKPAGALIANRYSFDRLAEETQLAVLIRVDKAIPFSVSVPGDPPPDPPRPITLRPGRPIQIKAQAVEATPLVVVSSFKSGFAVSHTQPIRP
jgi:hypothetical protein